MQMSKCVMYKQIDIHVTTDYSNLPEEEVIVIVL